MTFYVPDELVLSPNNKPETLIEFIQLFAEIKQGIERLKFSITRSQAEKEEKKLLKQCDRDR